MTEATQTGRCPHCDDTGDVHSMDGEWRGICHCPAGDEIRTPSPAASVADRPTPTPGDPTP